jgi:hypothetical protein
MLNSGSNSYLRELHQAQAMWPELVMMRPTISGRLPSARSISVLTVGSGCSVPVAKFAESLFAATGAKVTSVVRHK